METPNPTSIPKYVENAAKTVTGTAARAQEQYAVLFEQAQGIVADSYKTSSRAVVDGYKVGYKSLSEGCHAAASRIDLSAVPGAETVIPYIQRATEKATEQVSERLAVPAEWVDGYFDLAETVIGNQRRLTDRIMDNQRQIASRVLTATPEDKAPTATKETAPKGAGQKSTTKKGTTKKTTAKKTTAKKTTAKAAKKAATAK